MERRIDSAALQFVVLPDVAYRPVRRKGVSADAQRKPKPAMKTRGGARSVLRAERDSPDPALLGEADPPLRRAIGELDEVDVGAELRNAPERHRPQRSELSQYRLVEQQLLARLRRHFRRHVL